MKILRSYKEGKFLIFVREDGKEARYDLSTNEIIGFRGKPVQSLQSQFVGVSMRQVIESFDNPNYQAFLQWIQPHLDGFTMSHLVKNIVEYSDKEQYFAAGYHRIDSNLRYKMSEVPKGLLAIIKQFNFTITNKLVQFGIKYLDILQTIASSEYTSIEKGTAISQIVDAGIEYEGMYWRRNNLLSLIYVYNYNPARLMKYVDELMTYEGLENFWNTVRDLYDHAKMCKEMSDKFEKYPRHFLTQHRIVSRNYARLKEHFDEINFKKRVDEDLAWTYENWIFLTPKSTQDIKDEAVQQSNCVASYIDRVIEGTCQILFMRNKEEPDKSVVTLEIRNYRVVQARGARNSMLNALQQDAVDKYELYLAALKKKREKAAQKEAEKEAEKEKEAE